MNMGPVRDRSNSPGGPDKKAREEYPATSRRTNDSREAPAADTRQQLRALADEKLRDCPDSDTSPEMREQRLVEVRARIANGYYSRKETQEAIVEKLFDSLDL